MEGHANGESNPSWFNDNIETWANMGWNIDGIEKYLDGIHDFLIQQKMDIPKVLENHKAFIYRTGKRKVGRPSGKRNKLTTRKYIWIKDKHQILLDNRKAHTTLDFN